MKFTGIAMNFNYYFCWGLGLLYYGLSVRLGGFLPGNAVGFRFLSWGYQNEVGFLGFSALGFRPCEGF